MGEKLKLNEYIEWLNVEKIPRTTNKIINIVFLYNFKKLKRAIKIKIPQVSKLFPSDLHYN